MHTVRRQPQYVDLFLLTHFDEFSSASMHSARRSWWIVVALTLGAAFLFSFAGMIQ